MKYSANLFQSGEILRSNTACKSSGDDATFLLNSSRKERRDLYHKFFINMAKKVICFF